MKVLRHGAQTNHGFIESPLRLIGRTGRCPTSTLSRRQKTLKVTSSIAARTVRCTCWSTAPIKVEGEGSGTPASMVARSAGNRRRKIHIGIDEKSLETGRPSSPPATWAMHRCCPSRWTRFRLIRRSANATADGAFRSASVQFELIAAPAASAMATSILMQTLKPEA